MPSFEFAKPKPTPQPAPEVAPSPVPAIQFATEKPRPPVNVAAATRGDAHELANLSDTVRMWDCPECPGIIRADGLALHHYRCPLLAGGEGGEPFNGEVDDGGGEGW